MRPAVWQRKDEAEPRKRRGVCHKGEVYCALFSAFGERAQYAFTMEEALVLQLSRLDQHPWTTDH